MGNLQIIYDGITIDFGNKPSAWEPLPVRRADGHTSDGGITETVSLGEWAEIFCERDMFASRAVFDQLLHWWKTCARLGRQYAIAFDGDKKVNTTVNASTPIGSSTIYVLSGTGILGGIGNPQRYRLETADHATAEIIYSLGYSTYVTVQSPYNLSAYAVGDVFRDVDYWPKVVCIDDQFPAKELDGGLFSFSHRFREDRA